MADRFETHGDFSWCELLTYDVNSAKKFYAELLGWTMDDQPMPEGAGNYTILKADDRPIGGIMKMPPQVPTGTPPHWGAYVTVDDVDAVAVDGQFSLWVSRRRGEFERGRRRAEDRGDGQLVPVRLECRGGVEVRLPEQVDEQIDGVGADVEDQPAGQVRVRLPCVRVPAASRRVVGEPDAVGLGSALGEPLLRSLGRGVVA